MCCVITIPGQFSGRAVRTFWIASVPPVDAPTAITAEAGNGCPAGMRGGGAAGAAATADGVLSRATLAARIFDARLRRRSPTDWGPPGLAKTSIAPASSASRAARLEAVSSELITITGIGW